MKFFLPLLAFVVFFPHLAFASAGSEIEYALDGCKNGDYEQYTRYRDKAYGIDASIKRSREMRAGFITAEGIKKCDALAKGSAQTADAWEKNGLQGDAVYDFGALIGWCPARTTYNPESFNGGQEKAAKLTVDEALADWRLKMADFYKKYPGTRDKLYKKDQMKTVSQADRECQAEVAANVAKINQWGKGVVTAQEKVSSEIIRRHKASQAADAARDDAVRKLLSGKKLQIFKRHGIPSEIYPDDGSDPANIARATTWVYKIGNQKRAEVYGAKGKHLGSVEGKFKWCTTTYEFRGSSLLRTSQTDCD